MSKILRAAAEAAEANVPAALVTVTGIAGSAPRSSGSRMLVYQDGRTLGTVGGGAFEFRVIEEAHKSIQNGRPSKFSVHLTHDLGMCCGGAMEAYIEPLEAILDLVIYGAGHVGAATARLATTIGFRVTLVDERIEYADPDQFQPEIRVHAADPMTMLDELPWGTSTFHLVVTHSHQVDQDLVQAILPRPVGWLGMIGSRTKVAKFFMRYRAAGMDESLFTKLSAPVGLSIGAETPEEIAVSIAAELIRLRRDADAVCIPLSDQAINARGGDGRAKPPHAKVR